MVTLAIIKDIEEDHSKVHSISQTCSLEPPNWWVQIEAIVFCRKGGFVQFLTQFPCNGPFDRSSFATMGSYELT